MHVHSTNTVGLITNTAVAIKVIHPEPQPVKPPVSSGITLFSPVRSGITFFTPAIRCLVLRGPAVTSPRDGMSMMVCVRRLSFGICHFQRKVTTATLHPEAKVRLEVSLQASVAHKSFGPAISVFRKAPSGWRRVNSNNTAIIAKSPVLLIVIPKHTRKSSLVNDIPL